MTVVTIKLTEQPTSLAVLEMASLPSGSGQLQVRNKAHLGQE